MELSLVISLNRNLILIGFRNLFRNKRRTLATGLALTAGFIGLFLVSAYIYRVKKAVEVASVYLHNKGHIAVFKIDSLKKYSSHPAKYILKSTDQDLILDNLNNFEKKIDFIGKFLTGNGLIFKGEKSIPFIASGFEPSIYKNIISHPDVTYWAADYLLPSAKLTAEVFIANKDVLSLTPTMLDLLDLKTDLKSLSVEDKSLQLIAKNFYNDLDAVELNVESLHTTGQAFVEDSSLMLPLESLQKLYATDGIQYFAIFLKNSSTAKSLTKNINNQFLNKNLPYIAYDFTNEDWNPFYVGTVGFLFALGLFFILLISTAILLSIMNSTRLSLFERIREIGSLRALGFNPTHLRVIFISENFILATFSLFFGLVFAFLISKSVNAANIRFAPPGAFADVQFLLVLEFWSGLSLALALMGVILLTTYFVVQKYCHMKVSHLLGGLNE